MTRKTFLILFLLVITSLNSFAMPDSHTPDFAFPKQVSENAQKDLQIAIKSGNSNGIIRALLDFSTAQYLIDSNNLHSTISTIEDVALSEKDPCTKSLLFTLLSDIYRKIYLNDKYKYDNRSNPRFPLPDDYHTWDGQQFKDKIISLCDSALSSPDALQATKLSEYKDVISIDDMTIIYYPSLYDFIARHIINTLTELDHSSVVFPRSWLCNYDIYQHIKFNHSSPIVEKILTIYQDLLAFNSNKPAPFIDCDINRIIFIKTNIHDYNDDAEGTAIDLLKALYKKYADNEYADNILTSIFELNISSLSDSKWLYYNCRAHKVKFPNCPEHNNLSYIIDQLSANTVTISTPRIIVPKDTFEVTITNDNARKFWIKIYKITQNYYNEESISLNATNSVLYKEIPFKSDSIVPFTEKTSIKIAFDEPGLYAFVPYLENSNNKERYYATRCTELGLQMSSYAPNGWAMVINPKTGAPVQDADIYICPNNNMSILEKKIGTSDASGLLSISNPDNRIVATKDGNISTSIYSSYHQLTRSTEIEGNIFTDLAIYHPGDIVNWSAILYSVGKDKRSPLRNSDVTITLFDANWTKLSTLSLSTDKWGRINSSFTLPKDGLTGNFIISISLSNNSQHVCSRYFTVSDYKLPTYFIETDELTKNPQTGDITLKGKAQSYAGVNLSNINISIDLGVKARYFWFGGSSTSFYSTSITTDSDGNFAIIFPAKLLDTAPIPNGIFCAELTATSASGETQSTTKLFTMGPAYNISAYLDNNIDAAQPLKLDISITDLDDKIVNDTIVYAIKHDDTIIKQGRFYSTNPVIDLSDIPSGKYDFEFSLTNDSAEPKTIHDICLYRKSDKLPPVNAPLWVPETDFTTSNGRCSILYGTSASISHVFYTIWSSDGIISQGWLSRKPGLHHFDIELPAGKNIVNVTLAATNDYRHSQYEISITRENSIPKLNFTAESFRDKIIPATTETWTFKTTNHQNEGESAAVLMRMYSKALDALETNNWQFHPIMPWSPSFQISQTNFNAKRRIYVSLPIKGNYDYRIITRPKFLLNIPIAELELEESSIAYSISMVPLGADGVSVRTAHEKSLKKAEFGSIDNGSEAEQQSEQQSFSYRSSEVPLAFFEPKLETDSTGNLSFSFTVPNANTTWAFNAFAYNEQLLTNALNFDVIANKPIMVQPNLPRFLRWGDKADIKASVFNNTDSIQEVNTTVEIFDHISGKIVKQIEYCDTIVAGGSAVITTTIDAPDNASMLGYRIKSSIDAFADGEQSLIAILPSSTPVVETTPFYLGSSENKFSTQLPEMPNDSRVTLEFCENPTWYCVTALPGLRAENGQTSLSAMVAIFSAAVAEGIIRNNPSIASALHQWAHSDKSDSTLTSMLERNQDLKIILLNASPWVLDASSDTERMTRLSLLFDKKEISNTYTTNINKLAKLVRGNGGWGWIDSSSEISEWCTLNILSMYGQLKQLGYAPNEDKLSKMIEVAVKAIDDSYARKYAKYPDADYSAYVIARDFYPEIKQSTAAKRVTTATVQRLISDWKHQDVANKAISALILNNNGYHSTAKQILNSLREFAQTSKAQGMWWPSLNSMSDWSMSNVGATSIILDAFHAIEPSCKEIDLIRQWIILQKEAKNWGTSVTTCEVIASILNSGSTWHNAAHGVEVTINGQPVVPSKVEQVTGYFRNDISSMNPSKAVLSVYKTSQTPSWGAVYCQYNDIMSDVKAQSCDAISIEKRILKQVNTPNGVAWEIANTIEIGDKVKVELIVKSTRDMDYVAIIDDRAACFEPVEQLPTPIFAEGIYFYRENRDDATNMFVTHLPKGTYVLTYELFANNSGSFMSGIASVQSQYAPALSAHSAGNIIIVK